jgi:transposase
LPWPYNSGMRSKGSASELEQRRRLAVRRVAEGWKQKDVAAFLGVSERAVGRWLAAHRAAGDDGLKAKPHPGRAPYLTADQEREVLAWLVQPATAFGYPTALWSARRVADRIARQFGVPYHPNYLRAWLAQRALSPQKPARRARERDPAAIDRWLAEGWPALKKKQPRNRRTSS